MLNARIPTMKGQLWISLALFGLAVCLAWEIGGKIVEGNFRQLEFAALGFAACAVAVVMLRNWRAGFYFFLLWLLFEDFARKYMGNATLLFFGKDVLLALVYIAFYVASKRSADKKLRAPFLFFLAIFFWLGVLQVFNPHSPSVLYGLLGLKLYFYYIPLMYLGYALIRNDEDLRKFLLFNVSIAALIGSLGIAQAILGNSFLNPAVLAPELQDLGSLDKVTPLSGQVFSLPDSVFVSNGRFAEYLIVAIILALGTAGYLILYSRRGRKAAFIAIGILAVATLMSGSRGAVLSSLISAVVLSAAFIWGAPWHHQQGHRLVKTIRRSFIGAALALAALIMIFPSAAGSRVAFYAETLLPSSSGFQLANRTWSYPMQNLLEALSEPHWVVGNGIGVGSLGTQYVAGLLGQRPPEVWVEEGYGDLIVEMGILAPFLWLLWTGALLYFSWKVVRRLRGTRFLPIGVAILWYAFWLLYPLMYGGLATYENYINNAYLWLLLGILFRLPDLPANPTPAAAFSMQPSTAMSDFDGAV